MTTWFGNCLERLEPAGDRNQFTSNIEFITLIDQNSLGDAVEHFEIQATPMQLLIHGEWVQVPDGAGSFVPNNESRPWPLHAQAKDIGRYAAYQYAGDAPSSYETYRLIAEVLANRDPARWRPTLTPNNHWTNWPQAGSL